VALVGNGPLSEAQRKEINTYDVVVRCAKGFPPVLITRLVLITVVLGAQKRHPPQCACITCSDPIDLLFL
jgi:hypothetical protein